MTDTKDDSIVLEPYKYALFLDDMRKPFSMIYDDGIPWVIVRDYDQFVDYITKKGLPYFVTFDHDLSNEHYESNDVSTYKEKTGFNCAQWLIEYCMNNNLKLPLWKVHSMNPLGKKNIIDLLKIFKR